MASKAHDRKKLCVVAFKNKMKWKSFTNVTLKKKITLSLHKRLFLKCKVAHKTLLNWAFIVSSVCFPIHFGVMLSLTLPGVCFHLLSLAAFLCRVINLEFQLLGI